MQSILAVWCWSYGADNGRMARIIMSSMVLAPLSFSLLAWAFGIRPG